MILVDDFGWRDIHGYGPDNEKECGGETKLEQDNCTYAAMIKSVEKKQKSKNERREHTKT